MWHFLTIDGNRPFGIFTSQWCASDIPDIYYIHGGGMILGDVAGEDATAAMRCAEVGAVVVSVEYRRAPEHPQRTSAGRDRIAGLGNRRSVGSRAGPRGSDCRCPGCHRRTRAPAPRPRAVPLPLQAAAVN
ncbi:MAG TPA: alpha/beta hydrolase fold domain-containing protein [Pseudonocardia sp.]|nr:alpha/beta hydrolase fold domain-containing protein [Pseudonocardia sp.]